MKMKNWSTGKMTMKKHFYCMRQPESEMRTNSACEFTI